MFLFSKKINVSQAKENDCYELASLFAVIKFNGENDDLFEA